MLVLGNKKDLMQKTRNSYFAANTKILQVLKQIDPDNLIIYAESVSFNFTFSIRKEAIEDSHKKNSKFSCREFSLKVIMTSN